MWIQSLSDYEPLEKSLNLTDLVSTHVKGGEWFLPFREWLAQKENPYNVFVDSGVMHHFKGLLRFM